MIPDTQGVRTTTKPARIRIPTPVIPPTDGRNVPKRAQVTSNTFEARQHYSRDGYDIEGNPTPLWEQRDAYLERHAHPPVVRGSKWVDPAMVAGGDVLQEMLRNTNPAYLGRVRAFKVGKRRPKAGKHEVSLSEKELTGDKQALADTLARRLASNRALHMGKDAGKAAAAAKRAKWYNGTVFDKQGITEITGPYRPPEK